MPRRGACRSGLLSTNHEIEIFSVVVAGTPFRTFHYTLEKIMIFLSF